MKPRLAIGAPLKNENILWATKFFTPDPFVLLEADGKKIMVVSQLEHDRARAEAKVDMVFLETDLKENVDKKPISLEEQALFLLKGRDIRLITVAPDFPASTYHYLSKNDISVEFQDPLFPERSVKTKNELEDITHAQKSMEEVFLFILGILAESEIREGKLWNRGKCVTSEMLRTIFDTELMKRNCVCDATIIASGDQAADPHCLGFGPIIANVPIIFDMFPRSRRNWFWSDMTRTVVKGKLNSKAREMYKAVYETQIAALELIKPGVDGCDIHDFVVKEFEKRGFKTGQVNERWQGFFHSTGHGVGLEIHEWPRIAARFKNQILEPGNVFTIEPGLYYKGIGGVRIEDTVCVTENGYTNFAKFFKTLTEIP